MSESSIAAKKNRRGHVQKRQILQEAIRLADRDGLSKLSMRNLAGALKVEAMSLYHHFKNKDEILDGIVDLVFEKICWPKEGTFWKSAMRQRGVSSRVVLTEHGWAVGLLESRKKPGRVTLQSHDDVLGCLRNAGFSVKMAAHAYSVLDSYTYGFVLTEQSLPIESDEDMKGLGDKIMSDTPIDIFPNLSEMIIEHVSLPDYSYANEFLLGLDLILDGLERIIERN